MGVAEVVEANAREAGRARHDAIEDLGDGLGVEESTACVEEHPVVGAVGEPVAGEAVSPPSENGDGGVVESMLRRLVRVLTSNSTGRPATFCNVRLTDIRCSATSKSDQWRPTTSPRRIPVNAARCRAG